MSTQPECYIGTRQIAGRVRHIYWDPHRDQEYYLADGERIYLPHDTLPEWVGGTYSEHSRRDF